MTDSAPVPYSLILFVSPSQLQVFLLLLSAESFRWANYCIGFKIESIWRYPSMLLTGYFRLCTIFHLCTTFCLCTKSEKMYTNEKCLVYTNERLCTNERSCTWSIIVNSMRISNSIRLLLWKSNSLVFLAKSRSLWVSFWFNFYFVWLLF